MKKVLVRRKWFWWEVVAYSSYELGAAIEYVYPKKFFSKANAKKVASGIRFE